MLLDGLTQRVVTMLVLATVACTPVVSQKQAPASEKEARTPAQRKINSQILYEIYRRRGIAAKRQVPPGPTGVQLDPQGRALVDVRADVSPALERKIRALGATVVSTSRPYRSVIAWVPLLRIERLAADPAVVAIEPKAEPAIRQPEQLEKES